ncbi:hypothetical protein [Streptomyces acidicola]|uniref:Uncharacterized protein n=1 Tax=Streptomyces acidicola TaxID=2596892 RepID=A0A5N8WVK6_9ACTN|nr:hypothetical protein [Streptomyces acidicola]MPY50245.1 hypothetical protein [Streptomyces acidicola]
MNQAGGDTHNYNVNNVIVSEATDLLKAPLKTPRLVARDQLIRLRRQFARPRGINAAYDVLEAEHTVFLTGEPGSGRSSAAKVLLCELPHEKGIYHELTPETGAEDTSLPPDLIGEEDRILLDLSAADAKAWSTALHDLSAFRHELLRKRAFLAVVPPRQFENGLPSEFILRTIHRPDAREVLARHLRSHQLDDAVWQPLPQQLLEHLDAHPPMRELARLVQRIVAARGAVHGRGAFAEWCETALTAQKDRTREVAELLPRLRKGRQRALLLATAMLHGARVEAVHHATPLLLKEVDSTDNALPPLERKGLLERLDTIEAEMAPGAVVCFKQPDFDEAARRYLWANLPDVRAPLGTWLGKILQLRELNDPDRESVVKRYTDLCLSSGTTDPLFALVENWTRDNAPRTTEVRAAAHILQRGVEEEQFGGDFRRRIYDWSISRPTGNLREVLVEVCEKAMSVHHPEPALVRLHHLARNEPRPGVARDALRRYVRQDTRLQRRLLARLATSQNSRYHRADADLFLDLSAFPDDFLLRASTRQWLIDCWRMVFDLVAPHRWAPGARNWLVAADAVDNVPVTNAALDILVDAAAARYPVLSRVYADARRAVSSGLSARLLETINKAQSSHLAQRSPKLEVSPT